MICRIGDDYERLNGYLFWGNIGIGIRVYWNMNLLFFILLGLFISLLVTDRMLVLFLRVDHKILYFDCLINSREYKSRKLGFMEK